MTVLGRDPWTVDDFDRLPDDGVRYELHDGMLLVTPSPSPDHQRASGRLYLLLHAACPPGLEVFYAPFDLVPSTVRAYEPDLLVIPTGLTGKRARVATAALVVEILSPSTRSLDLLVKHQAYADAGIPTYLVVDPLAPSAQVFVLQGDHYVDGGAATGDEVLVVEQPFRFEVAPSALRLPPPG